MRLVVAVHTREVKTALFLAINGLATVTIAATATSSAELISYARSLQPDVVIVESSLPGRPIEATFADLEAVAPDARVVLIDSSGAGEHTAPPGNVETFEDLDQLIAAFPETGADGG